MAARRMIRNWTESEKVDTLSAEGERFFTRLMMVADDYGSFPENLTLIKSKCFPLKEKLSAVKVAEWLDELITADIVFKYSVDGKNYIRIRNFDQRVQSKKNIYPHPLENGDSRKKTVDHGELSPELEREVEVEVEQKKKEKVNDPRDFGEKWKAAFDEGTLETYGMQFKHLDIKNELQIFELKCNADKGEYHSRSPGGLRLGFIKQLKFSKGNTQKNGQGAATNHSRKAEPEPGKSFGKFQ